MLTNIFRQLIVPWLLALLLAWLLIVVWLHSETRYLQQQQIQQLAVTVNFALQANLPTNNEQQLTKQLRQIHDNSPLAVEQIAAYNGQLQLIASSIPRTKTPALNSAPSAYQVNNLTNGRQLAVLPVSAGLDADYADTTGQLSDHGYIAVVFNTEIAWLVWLIPLALLSGAMSLGLGLSVSVVKRGQLRQGTDIELLAHHFRRLQGARQQCQITEPLVAPLRPVQQAFNELAGILDQRQLATEQLVQQLNQRVQQLNGQCAELEQQRQRFTTGQQLQQRQIQHWFEQSLALWQRKTQVRPVQLQPLLQMHLLAGHYQFGSAGIKGQPITLGSWLSQHRDELNALLPSESVMLDWQEHPDNLAYSVDFCSHTLKSLLQALIMLGLRAGDVSKISMTVQLQITDEQHHLVLAANCNGNGLPAHCQQLIQTDDMLDLQWGDVDVALLKSIQAAGASFSTQSLDGLGCILQLTIPVQSEPVSTEKLLQHVLVVDDNETNLAFVQVLLKNKPLILHTATSAAQVFSACKQRRFDMILLDIQLPDMSGVEVTRQLRQMPLYHKVPIVAFTAHAMPSEIHTYREAGMDDIVFKPLEPARLDSLLAKFSLTS